MKTQVMITNRTDFSMNYIYEFLAGYRTKLEDKISVEIVKGVYYDNIYINSK